MLLMRVWGGMKEKRGVGGQEGVRITLVKKIIIISRLLCEDRAGCNRGRDVRGFYFFKFGLKFQCSFM